jgi:hypothetical protein
MGWWDEIQYPYKVLGPIPKLRFVEIRPGALPDLIRITFVMVYSGPPAWYPNPPTPDELLAEAAKLNFKWEFWPE